MNGVGGAYDDGGIDGGGQQWTMDAALCAPDHECVTPKPGDGAVSDGGPRRDAAEPDGAADPGDGGDPPVATTYKIDLLFVVDNSISMLEKQATLRAQFPMLLEQLLSSTEIGGGGDVVPGAQDVHLGVVSTDLGTPGLDTIRLCEGLGDNGVLNNAAAADAVGCSATTYEPRFLSYVAGTDDAAQLATDFACIAALGNEGCGFEQQLESMLKAVWLGADDRVMFATDLSGMGATGQSGEGFPNADFVRHDEDDVSVLAVVMVTDEEDCSASSVAHLDPSLPDNMETLGLRCYYETLRPEPNNIYDVERYVEGLRALRPGHEQRVVFGAIVGVPPDLVTEQKMAAVDFGDADARAAYYRTILEDPRMQQTIDDNGTPDLYDDVIAQSCTAEIDGTLAFPPPRIVEVARGFGEQGFVQSICGNDWSVAMELLAKRIAKARSE